MSYITAVIEHDDFKRFPSGLPFLQVAGAAAATPSVRRSGMRAGFLSGRIPHPTVAHLSAEMVSTVRLHVANADKQMLAPECA
jgi:hypothetical protein